MILLVIALTRIYAVSANNQINSFERTLEEPSINVWRQTIDVPESKKNHSQIWVLRVKLFFRFTVNRYTTCNKRKMIGT